MSDALLVEMKRGGIVESTHRGSLAIIDADGTVAKSFGDTASHIWPRSCNKPLQSVALVEAGLRLEPRLLALTASSHSGSDMHIEGALEILRGAQRTVDDLRGAPDLPLGDPERAAYLRRELGPDRLAANCSGKHAGFIATCVINGWRLDNYLSPEHPLQVRIRETIERLAHEPVEHVTIDGCGAPLFSLSLVGLARGFRSLAKAQAPDPRQQVAAAMRAFPEMVAGEGREVTIAMRAIPGLIAKDGVEGVLAMALPDGRAMAMKISDGNRRGLPVVAAAVLRYWGVDESVVAKLPMPTVVGGDLTVGGFVLAAEIARVLAIKPAVEPEPVQ